MSLLLAADAVTLYASAGEDEHGWTLPELGSPVWSGLGSLQRQPGRSDPRAEAGGGSGPYNPNAGELATLYLPPEAPVCDGLVAEVGGRRFYLSATRLVGDPRGSGELDCHVATATESGQWVA